MARMMPSVPVVLVVVEVGVGVGDISSAIKINPACAMTASAGE